MILQIKTIRVYLFQENKRYMTWIHSKILTQKLKRKEWCHLNQLHLQEWGQNLKQIYKMLEPQSFYLLGRLKKLIPTQWYCPRGLVWIFMVKKCGAQNFTELVVTVLCPKWIFISFCDLLEVVAVCMFLWPIVSQPFLKCRISKIF